MTVKEVRESIVEADYVKVRVHLGEGHVEFLEVGNWAMGIFENMNDSDFIHRAFVNEEWSGRGVRTVYIG